MKVETTYTYLSTLFQTFRFWVNVQDSTESFPGSNVIRICTVYSIEFHHECMPELALRDAFFLTVTLPAKKDTHTTEFICRWLTRVVGKRWICPEEYFQVICVCDWLRYLRI